MRKIIATLFGLVIIVVSCTPNKGKNNVEEQNYPQEETGSFFDEDTTLIEEIPEEIVEDPVPDRADELFDDFLYHYASSPRIQRRRTVFPLPYYTNDSQHYIEREEWDHDSLFIKREGYTIIFDNEEDMDMTEDTELTSVQYERVDMKSRLVTRYFFERKDRKWVLEGIREFSLEDAKKEDFIEFLYKFSTDSIFQEERIQHPLLFVTTDPDDDFSILESTIDRTQWRAFKPVLSREKLSNINYGQENSWNSPHKILALKGIGNGFSSTLYFQKFGGLWKLYKFEDTSN